VRRHGVPIQEAGIRHRLSHGITYTSRYESFDACVKTGLDVERWMAGGYDRKLMAQVVAYNRLSSLIETHLDDARSRALSRKGRK
jgi:hypothetical protein